MGPIRINLDTSDYSVMNDAPPGSPIAHVREKLVRMTLSGQIEIGLSYHVVFELLQQADPEYRNDRLSRARLLSELCGRNAFPYPTDLGRGYRFSKDGLWQPRITLDDHEIEVVVGYFMKGVQLDSESTSHIRRVVSRRKYLRRLVEESPNRFAVIANRNWPLMFGRSLVDDGTFGRYLAGTVSRAEVNEKLWFFITDPASIFELWFEQCGWSSPIVERRENIATMFVTMLRGFRETMAKQSDLRATVSSELKATGDGGLMPDERAALLELQKKLKIFRSEMMSPEQLCDDVPRWRELFGDESAALAAQIFYAFERENRPIKKSDGIDFVHALYLPHTDLWRGDRSFADLLRKHEVRFSDRVVPTLLELPARIEAAS